MQNKYWESLKYIVFVYQKEISNDYQKLIILKKYVKDLTHYPYRDEQLKKQLDRELYIQKLNKEIDNIEKTNIVNINASAIKEIGRN